MLPLRRYERISTEKSAISLQRGPVDPTFQVEGFAPTNHFFSQKTRLNDLSYGIKIWTDFSSVLSQSTRLTDRRTDSFLVTRPRCIQCSAVKIVTKWQSSYLVIMPSAACSGFIVSTTCIIYEKQLAVTLSHERDTFIVLAPNTYKSDNG